MPFNLSLFDKYSIATEADDIAASVSKTMGGEKSPVAKANSEREDDDLTQTDNLFGDAVKGKDSTARPLDNPTETEEPSTHDDNVENNSDQPDNKSAEDMDSPTDDAPTDETDPPQDDSPTDDSSSPDDSSSNDPFASSGGDGDSDGGEPEAPKSVFSDKNTLRDNMIYFFNILRSNIDSLSDGLSTLDDMDSIRVVNSVIKNLRNCKNLLYKMLTENLDEASYEAIMTKYVTLKRIYDISIEMLDKHFYNVANPIKTSKLKRFKKG